MVGSRINDIKLMLSDIEKKLNAIQEENDENINDIINIETSSRYCIGSLLYSYGKVYKIIFDSENYEQAILRLEKLRLNDEFEHIDEEIQHFENVLIRDLKSGRKYFDAQLDLEDTLQHEHIFEIILRNL